MKYFSCAATRLKFDKKLNHTVIDAIISNEILVNETKTIIGERNFVISQNDEVTNI